MIETIRKELEKARKLLPSKSSVHVEYYCGMQDAFRLAENTVLATLVKSKAPETKNELCDL